MHPGVRGAGPGRHLPHRVGARLGAAPRQERRPGVRDRGAGRPGADLHADLRERRPGAPRPSNSSDDLSDVLDDAQLVGTPIAGAGLTATVNGTQLDVTGTVPAGATRTVTYQVQVRPWAAQGDHVLANALACESGRAGRLRTRDDHQPGGPPGDRQVVRTARSTASPATRSPTRSPAHNDGPGDFTAADQASVVDDLTGVLDDATYGNDAAVGPGCRADVRRSADHLGRCARARRHGDDHLHRGAQGRRRRARAQRGVAAGRPGQPRARRRTARPRRGRATPRSFDLPKLTIKKTSNRAQLPAAGQKITYTVTVTNPGPGDYTAAHPATFSDDLPTCSTTRPSTPARSPPPPVRPP